jgi:cell division septation protein DedD
MSVAVGCVLFALTGCGSGAPPSPAGMSADVQAQLRNDLRILATAAAAHNVPAAQAALAAMNADTAAAHAAGKLSASKLAQIRAAAAAVAVDLTSATPSPTRTTPATPTPTPTRTHDKGGGDGGGKGGGNGGGD